MEAKCMSKAKAKHSPLDIISTLPQSITETILCLIPIEDAARTSILSRDWRYKWTTIPKLAFYDSIVYRRTSEAKQTSNITSAEKKMDRRSKLLYAIYQVLLLRQGPIHEFELHMNAEGYFEVDQIILNLSRNHTIKKLKLGLGDTYCYKLPLCTFSLHQLTDLELRCIDLDHQPIFSGFASLKRLCLDDVYISTKPLLHLLSNCPSLTSFTLCIIEPGRKDCTIIELFECLPKIEQLISYGYSILPWLVLDSVPRELPTLLINLKYLRFEKMWLVDDGLPLLAIFIKCSPNLEKISLEIDLEHDSENSLSSCILEEYSDVRLEHLIELEIDLFSNLKPEMEFVKFILARSPKLKKVWISCVVEKHQEELEVLKTLLRAPRTSFVEIVVV